MCNKTLLSMFVFAAHTRPGLSARDDDHRYSAHIAHSLVHNTFVGNAAFVECGQLTELYGIEVGLKVGSYNLGKCLGGGSFGEVWEAFPADSKLLGVRADSGKVVMKISKTPYGKKDFRGQDPLENQLKECLFARAMKQRDTAHFADCYDLSSFSINGETLAYAVTELVQGRDLQNALFKSSVAPKELPRLADVVDLVLQLYYACDKMIGHSDIKFFHNDLQPSNLMMSRRQEHLYLAVLDYGEASICCESGTNCMLDDGGLRARLGLTYGARLEPCSQKNRSGRTVNAEGVDSTTLFLVMNFLSALCTPQPARSPAFAPIFNHEEHPEETVIDNVLKTIRDAYQSELENTIAMSLLRAVIGAAYRDVLNAAGAEVWPPQDFFAKMKALGDHLNAATA